MKISMSVLGLATLLLGCASQPSAPDWQMNAQGSIERLTAAYMNGDTAIETAEFKLARDQIARTGKIDLIARIELIRCATRVASLVFEECAGFEKLRQDAGAQERAYADYLAGRMPAGAQGTAQDTALLPEPQRAAANASSDAAAAAAVQGIPDPLSKLVAAGVLLRTGRASPALLADAVDTASNQGWRRPLLAWLGVQAMRFDQAGATADAQQIRRRIDLVQAPVSGLAPGP